MCSEVRSLFLGWKSLFVLVLAEPWQLLPGCCDIILVINTLRMRTHSIWLRLPDFFFFFTSSLNALLHKICTDAFCAIFSYHIRFAATESHTASQITSDSPKNPPPVNRKNKVVWGLNGTTDGLMRAEDTTSNRRHATRQTCRAAAGCLIRLPVGYRQKGLSKLLWKCSCSWRQI